MQIAPKRGSRTNGAPETAAHEIATRHGAPQQQRLTDVAQKSGSATANKTLQQRCHTREPHKRRHARQRAQPAKATTHHSTRPFTSAGQRHTGWGRRGAPEQRRVHDKKCRHARQLATRPAGLQGSQTNAWMPQTRLCTNTSVSSAATRRHNITCRRRHNPAASQQEARHTHTRPARSSVPHLTAAASPSQQQRTHTASRQYPCKPVTSSAPSHASSRSMSVNAQSPTA